MMYANIQPLSEIEKRDAEQHHNWVTLSYIGTTILLNCIMMLLSWVT